MESLQFAGDINLSVIMATVLASWFLIKNLKKHSKKFPLRQVVPFIVAIILTTLYEYTMGDGLDRTVIWNSLITALIATGGYSKVKSLLKDRGIEF